MTEEFNNLDNQLTRAWNARWNQDQVLWRIFGAYWPTNAILLAALFRTGGSVLPRPVAIITCLAGVFVASVWYLVQRRALANIKRLEATAQRIEERLLLGPNLKYALSPKLNSVDSLEPSPRLTARLVMPTCTGIVGAAWLIGLLF